jgi:hypothetical protein
MNTVDASLTTLLGGRCHTDHVPPPTTVIYADRPGKNWFTALVPDTTLTVELGDGDVWVIRRTTTQPMRSIQGQQPRTATSFS